MGAFNDRLLFIHIPKTGGTAIKKWLWDHLPGVTGQRPAIGLEGRSDGKLPIGHVPLRDIEHYTGRSPESFEKIVAIIRNPYSQQLSQWQFWRERFAVGGRHPHDIGAASAPDMLSWLSSPACDFHVWYEQTHATHRAKTPTHTYDGFGGYYKYWLSVGGLIPGNVEVVHIETLDKEWPKVVEGFVDNPHAPVQRINSGPKRPYPLRRYFFDRKARAIVESKFAWAFEHHYEVMR